MSLIRGAQLGMDVARKQGYDTGPRSMQGTGPDIMLPPLSVTEGGWGQAQLSGRSSKD